MRRVRRELVAHVGGRPNAVERQLIERAVRLSLALELYDEMMMHEASFLAKDHNKYVAMSNALGRALTRLGIKAADAKPPNALDYLRAKAAP
jgi:hypothetical protein